MGGTPSALTSFSPCWSSPATWPTSHSWAVSQVLGNVYTHIRILSPIHVHMNFLPFKLVHALCTIIYSHNCRVCLSFCWALLSFCPFSSSYPSHREPYSPEAPVPSTGRGAVHLRVGVCAHRHAVRTPTLRPGRNRSSCKSLFLSLTHNISLFLILSIALLLNLSLSLSFSLTNTHFVSVCLTFEFQTYMLTSDLA